MMRSLSLCFMRCSILNTQCCLLCVYVCVACCVCMFVLPAVCVWLCCLLCVYVCVACCVCMFVLPAVCVCLCWPVYPQLARVAWAGNRFLARVGVEAKEARRVGVEAKEAGRVEVAPGGSATVTPGHEAWQTVTREQSSEFSWWGCFSMEGWYF